MKLRSLSFALAVMVLASALATDVLARKGGRSGASGNWSGKGQAWHGKGHGHGKWHGHRHSHSHIFLGAGFYGPWYAWDPWWPTLYPNYYPFGVPISSEQSYIEQHATPLQSGFWYYCHSAAVYYPGVAECPEGWEQVAPLSAPAQ